MKLLYLLLILAFVSCGSAMDEKLCLESVKEQFPNSKIYQSPRNRYAFIVIDSSSVKYVTTTSLTSTNINGIETLKQLK